ncbi:hypothetical protein PoB_001381700 [Plakobranchus ocellatus]|uniref:Uncharacterized protein n=1 Tax=Plakobranchus ocellatus TaxID=259542 RepID=A0AAV3YYA4_9GAST|nr:hypothetical protein PoB_001381700 [Plakobranchus ocellatus]
MRRGSMGGSPHDHLILADTVSGHTRTNRHHEYALLQHRPGKTASKPFPFLHSCVSYTTSLQLMMISDFCRGNGDTVDNDHALKSAGNGLPRGRALPSAPWPAEGKRA